MASGLMGWVGYIAGLQSLDGPRSGLAGAGRDHYLQGHVAGSFLLPCLIALCALIPKGRSTQRVLVVYSVAAVIFSLTTFAGMMGRP